MTITRHLVGARMALTYYATASVDYYTDFTEWDSGALPPDWSRGGTVLPTVVRGLDDASGKSVPRVTWTSAGLGSFVWSRILAVGTRYRATVVVRNAGTTTVQAQWTALSAATTTTVTLAPGASATLASDGVSAAPPTGPTPGTFTGTLSIRATDGISPADGTLLVVSISITRLALQQWFDLKPEQAQVSLDESRWPYAQADLVCPIPDPGVLAALDPRKGQRIQLTLSQTGGEVYKVSTMTALASDTSTVQRVNAFTKGRPQTTTELTSVDTWTHLNGTGETGSTIVLTTELTTYPNNLAGAVRWVVDNPAASGGQSAWRLTSRNVGSALNGTDTQVSIYVRSSVACTVLLSARTLNAASATVGAASGPLVALAANVWTRLSVIVRNPGGSLPVVVEATASVQGTDPLPRGTAFDATQAMAEGVATNTSPAVGDYFDARTGKLTPQGIPTANSLGMGLIKAMSRYVVSNTPPATVADVTEMFHYTSGGLPGWTAAYLTDVFTDQYNRTPDPAYNAQRQMNLGLRERHVDYLAGTMRLVLTSDEMLLEDYGRVSVSDPTTVPPATTDLRTLVNWALNLVGGSLDASSVTATVTAPAADSWEQGADLWSFLDGFVTEGGLRLRCDERRRWFLEAPMSGAGGTVTITSLVRLDDDLTREDWADSVVLANEWTDPATGNVKTTYAGQPVPYVVYTKTLKVTKQAKATATAAAAQALLNRVQTRGRRVSLVAVNNYLTTPGMTADIRTPATTIDPVMVASVEWSWPGDEMTVTTRDKPL